MPKFKLEINQKIYIFDGNSPAQKYRQSKDKTKVNEQGQHQ